jgi:serine/threonine protein phosphatase 1
MDIYGPTLARHDFDGPVAVVGDVHGELALLDRLLAEIGDMPLVFVGDLVDRGPDSRGVVQRMIDTGAIGVRGNHEEWFVAWAHGLAPGATAVPMFGEPTLTSYGVPPGELPPAEAGPALVPESHRELLRGLPVVIDLGVGGQRYWLLHAGVPRADRLQDLFDDTPPRPTDPAAVVPWLARHRRDSCLWVKTLPEDMPVLDRPIVFGHTSFPLPIDCGHAIALDTGAGRWPDAALTAVVLPERRFVSVRSA